MTNRRFDFGTAGFILSLLALTIIWYEVSTTESYIARIHRLEDAVRASCIGKPKIEVCATLGLPLDLPKFNPRARDRK